MRSAPRLLAPLLAAGLALVAARSARADFDEELPALRANATIVFVGDSITDGGRTRTGQDFNHTMGQSYAYILAATLGERLAERNLTFVNRGIGGDRVADLQARWRQDVLDLRPDLVSILVGINDTFWAQGETLEEFERTYDQVLRETREALPATKIVLGEPFFLPVGFWREDYSAMREQVRQRQEVVARLAEKHQLPLIRYQAAFDAACERAPADHWSWDGVHPHYAGHGLIAGEWLKTVNGLAP